jgi:hypothetical protein
MVRVMLWVRRTHGDKWYYSIGQDGVIRGRRHAKGKPTERQELGTVEQALAAVPVVPADFGQRQ